MCQPISVQDRVIKRGSLLEAAPHHISFADIAASRQSSCKHGSALDFRNVKKLYEKPLSLVGVRVGCL